MSQCPLSSLRHSFLEPSHHTRIENEVIETVIVLDTRGLSINGARADTYYGVSQKMTQGDATCYGGAFNI